ncbi:unnamed protein product [Lampetra planeri]
MWAGLSVDWAGRARGLSGDPDVVTCQRGRPLLPAASRRPPLPPPVSVSYPPNSLSPCAAVARRSRTRGKVRSELELRGPTKRVRRVYAAAPPCTRCGLAGPGRSGAFRLGGDAGDRGAASGGLFRRGRGLLGG